MAQRSGALARGQSLTADRQSAPHRCLVPLRQRAPRALLQRRLVRVDAAVAEKTAAPAAQDIQQPYQRVFNFSAGPAVLPVTVLEEAQRDLLNWQVGRRCFLRRVV